VALRGQGGAVVVVINTVARVALYTLWTTFIVWTSTSFAAVLPEERIDLLHHNYNGGGMQIDGPAVLVRKNLGEQVSVSGHYLVDSVSAASVDVESYASPYREERIEKSISSDFLIEKTIYSLGYSTSDESDYNGKSYAFGVSQDFFGDLTTLSLGYSIGDDTVGNSTDMNFSEDVDRRTFQLGLSQILTSVSVLGIALEFINDEGYLNNPYRPVRYQDNAPGNTKGWSTQAEVYPNTRHSNALALTYTHYFQWDGALVAQYRYYTDSWDLQGNTLAVELRKRLGSWILSTKLRGYTQTAADFYSDLFPFSDAQNFLARDKELSTFNTVLVGIGARYNLKPSLGFVKKAEVGIMFDRHMLQYDNFRDIRQSGFVAGQEPLYAFGANVVRFNLLVWF